MTEQHDDRKPGSVKPRISAMERLQIQSGLDSASSLYAIGKAIGRSVRTITREVIARAKMTATGPALRLANKCVHRFDCLKRRICAICLHRRSRPCRLCNQCNTHCADYVEDECGRLSKPPYVCNGCAERSKCVLTKRLYRADEAQKDYESKLSEPRRGVNLSEEEIARFDGILRELTGKGQSPHAIMANNRDLFTICERSLYAYINSGILMTKRGDLPRACSIKPRKGDKPVEARVDKSCRSGRTHDLFLERIAEKPGAMITEVDTVEGRRGGKSILTLCFTKFRFMAGFLLEAKSAACVKGAFATILARLAELYGGDNGRIFGTYMELFEIILGDLGGEFTDPLALECPAGAVSGDLDPRLVEMFYCDPYSAWQKAFVERNHEFVRYVLPKATHYTEAASFDDLTQSDVELLMSHVNCYPRRILKDKTPYELFTDWIGEDVASKVFGIRRIEPNEVTLKPSLLGIDIRIKEWVNSVDAAPSPKAK